MISVESGITDDLGLEIGLDIFVEIGSVHVEACSSIEHPLVPKLLAEIEVDIGDQQAITETRKARCARGIWSRHVGRAIEMAKVLVSGLAVSRGKFVGEVLSADAIDAANIVVVGDGCVAGFDGPHWFRKIADGGAGVEHNFSTVQAKHEPIEHMMTTEADIDANAAKSSFEHWMTSVSLEIVSRLIEIADARNVILAMFADVVSVIADDDSGVPDCVSMSGITFQDGGNDDHIVLTGLLLDEESGSSIFGILSEIEPRLFLSGAECKRHRPGLL